MDNSPKVNVVSDNLSKFQWGKGLLYKKDWKKDTIDRKKVMLFLTPFFILFLGFQVSDIGATTTSNKSESQIQKSENVSIPLTEDRAISKKVVHSETHPVAKFTAPQVVLRPRNLSAIPPGSLIRGILISGGSNGAVKAQLKDALTVNGEPLIESGSTLLGQGSSSEERLHIHFNQVIFKDGTYASVSADACDASDKIVGLKGSKIGNKALNIGGSIGLGFLGGLTNGLQETQGQNGVLVKSPTWGNALLNATSTTALEQSRNLMTDLKDKKPIIEVPSETEICVIFMGGN
jgi:hypothetical protein